MPGLERYVQEEPQFDGYSCGWWADREAFEASMRTQEWAALVEDGHGLWDEDFLWGMSAHIEEVPQIEGERGPYKAAWVLRFLPGMTRAEGREYWRSVHGPIFHGLDINRYTQNHVVGAKVFDVTGLWGAALEEGVVKDASVLA